MISGKCVKKYDDIKLSLPDSYKSCLPETHRAEIQRMTRLARYQIRKNLKHFLKKLGRCSAGERSLKLKYLMELSAVEPNYGSECFITSSSIVRVSGEGGIQTHSSDSQVTMTSAITHRYLTITTSLSTFYHTCTFPLTNLCLTFTTPVIWYFRCPYCCNNIICLKY